MKVASRVIQVVTVLVLALGLPLGSALTQGADPPVITMNVVGGSFTFALSNGVVEQVAFGHAGSVSANGSESVELTVDDARGNHEGWTIMLASTGFHYVGAALGDNDLPAGNATLIPQAPRAIAGTGLDGINASVPAPLDHARRVLTAEPGFGTGTYTQELVIKLDIPARHPAGTYTALLTVSASAAPGHGSSKTI